LAALNQFCQTHERALSKPKFPKRKERYDLTDPLDDSPVTVTVATEPDLTHQLEAMDVEADSVPAMADLPGTFPTLRDDYVPEGSIVLVTKLPAERVNAWQLMKVYISDGKPAAFAADHVPTVIIQTSRPKAKTLVSQLQAAQGINAVCFNPGRDPMAGEVFHLGLLQTGDGEFHLFVEFSGTDPQERKVVERWESWRKGLGERCIVMVASGVTGANRGRPSIRDAVAIFETRMCAPADLNLPPLQMSYALDWD
jgi:hypothetical protein